ncbi:hypothetical protein EDB92DRAFT_1943499 [Lactarius akahatsu]|uniref:Uncharacterized protein n=1 Tax=Lactarius akahatsu TaxID=416441 RepID=A0AAD4LPB1_9AGAM|nr:hypothetical protein EDB92DRAFT_1943499 [Lactarius akahatsu]
MKHFRIAERSYFTVPAIQETLLLTDYEIIVNLSLLTTDTMSRVIKFLRAFNSCDAFYWFEETSLRSTLPSPRRLSRRSAGTPPLEQAVILVELDKLKHDKQEHQNEIHVKLRCVETPQKSDARYLYEKFSVLKTTSALTGLETRRISVSPSGAGLPGRRPHLPLSSKVSLGAAHALVPTPRHTSLFLNNRIKAPLLRSLTDTHLPHLCGGVNKGKVGRIQAGRCTSLAGACCHWRRRGDLELVSHEFGTATTSTM